MNTNANPQPHEAVGRPINEHTLRQATDLHKAYNGKPALKGVSLSLAGCQMCALLGPNGAGKSTLLQVLPGCSA
ncbi:MAG: ATP-binding cassette domain-containing protein [Burkholderiaceae bacterium]